MAERKKTKAAEVSNGKIQTTVSERKKTIQSLLPIRNGMSDGNRKGVIDILHHQLADHYVLLTKTKFYHWNIEGPEFHDLHELLDQHYEIIAEQVDEIAEQALKLGGQAPGTLGWFKDNARLGEDPGDTIPDTRAMLRNLLADHEAVITLLHGDITKTEDDFDDKVTSNKLQEFSDQHHKMAWMIRMILQPSSLEDYPPVIADVRGRISEV